MCRPSFRTRELTVSEIRQAGKSLDSSSSLLLLLLITKEQYYETASSTFSGTQVNITKEGKVHLGAALGTQEYIDQFVKRKVSEWCSEVEKLARIAETQPHAAYAAVTHGLIGKWNYLSRTIPNIRAHLAPLESAIRTKLIPAITGRSPPSDTERDLLALPVRFGGLGIPDPSKRSHDEFSASLLVTGPLRALISEQNPVYSFEAWEEQFKARARIHKLRRDQQSTSATVLKPLLPSTLQRSMLLAQEKGASSWLTALPISEFDFTLHKGAFRDALCLRYGWQLSRIPTNCDCGTPFSVEHALSCPKGGFPSIRHNEIRDLTANLMSEVCNDVSVEPHLQPITSEQLSGVSANTQDGARLDQRSLGQPI